jgi:hypothetical protein
MSVTAIRKADGGDELAGLRRAVSDAQREKLAIDKAHASAERAEQQIRDAEQRLVAATALIEKERKRLADQMEDAATAGRQATAPGAMRAARLAAADAEDTLAAAKEALRSIQADLANMQTNAAAANRAVDAAVAETLKPVAIRLLSEARAHHLRFLTTSEALYVVGLLFNKLDGDEAIKQIDRVGSFSDEDMRVAAGVRQQWATAIGLLKTDPGTALPSLEE